MIRSSVPQHPPGSCNDRRPVACGLTLCVAVSVCLAYAFARVPAQVPRPTSRRHLLSLLYGSSPGRRSLTGPSEKVEHIFVQISDPQLGLLTQYGPNPKDWSDETDMLSRLLSKVVQFQPKPRFIFLGGDMQNFWPNEVGDGRNANSNVPNLTIDGRDLGFHQREGVKRELSAVDGHGIPVHFTAGNHDVGDTPNANGVNTMSMYAEIWGPHQHTVMHEDGILYLQFNSQLYWSADESLSEYKAQQNAWLDQALDKVTSSTRLLVLMTHIPPFMDDVHEGEGWANWRRDDREEVLDRIVGKLGRQKAPPPMLWVCGHFHGNMQKLGSYKGVPLHLRVTSSAGTTMQWDGLDTFTPAQAAGVAEKDVGAAFSEDIVSGDPANIARRLQAIRSRAGVRIFRVFADGSFQDHFFTLESLEEQGTHSVDALFKQLGGRTSVL